MLWRVSLWGFTLTVNKVLTLWNCLDHGHLTNVYLLSCLNSYFKKIQKIIESKVKVGVGITMCFLTSLFLLYQAKSNYIAPASLNTYEFFVSLPSNSFTGFKNVHNNHICDLEACDSSDFNLIVWNDECLWY